MLSRVKLATLLAFGLHGLLILSAQYRLSYDAYNHMFFADHYLRHWWALWEPRWYTGFEIISYPPLVHQVMALLARLMGVDTAFGLLLWLTLSAYPLAVYRFSRIFTAERAAGYAALSAALLPSLFLTAHTFGQLPTLVATLLALFAASVLADFLHRGDSLTGALVVCLFTTVMSAHHATLLFLPALVGVVFIRVFSQHKTHKALVFGRLMIVLPLFTLAGLVVIWPFWDWGRSQTIQATIDHASRHNFFSDPFAAVLFFLPMYGLLIPFIPVVFWLGRRKRLWGLGTAFLLLFLLGLGETTPLPRLFFGAGWAWLTYDRFAFWASLLMLPLFGLTLAAMTSTTRLKKKAKVLIPYYLASMGLTALIIGMIPSWLPTQPRPIAMQPIVDFLAQAEQAQYRYLTFGFGDQLAYLSRLTDATTIDGSYHTARTLPELRTSGIGQIDTAYWLPGGLAKLDPILQESGARGVRWGFVNLKLYRPVLQHNGWTKLSTLANGVEVWENPSAVIPTPAEPPAASPFKKFSWGFFPLLALSLSGGLALRRYWPAASMSLLTAIQALAIGLFPFGLTLWCFRPLFTFSHERIYFTYSDALFFLSDGLALVVVLTVFISRWPLAELHQMSFQPLKSFSKPTGWLFSLCLLASLSPLWSLDWRISLYIALHLWLCFTLYLALCNIPQAWRWFAFGSAAALALQVFIGFWQFASQSTLMNKPLGLHWPGDLIPSISGASVVQLADGMRWLRAYGTLPHPNLLGGFGLVLLAALLTLLLLPSKRRILSLALLNAGLALLVLTFSRSAWLGLAVFCVTLLFHRKKIDIKNLRLLAFTALLTLAGLLAWLSPLLFTRIVDNSIQTEQVSNYTRLWLVQRTLELVQQRPVLGAGIGSYSLALSQHVAGHYKIEPVHNLPLLVMGELGFGGLILFGGLVVIVVAGALKAQNPLTVVYSGLLLGVFTISLFDHYFWTLAPGRLLLFTLLGLCAGQFRNFVEQT